MTNQDFDSVSAQESKEELIDQILASKAPEEPKETSVPIKTEPNQKPPKKRRKKKNRALRGIILALLVLMIALGLSGGIIYLGMDMLAVNKPDEKLIVEIPNNAGVTAIAEMLKNEEVIKHPFLFRVVSKLEEADNYIAGKHEINKNMPYTGLIEVLQKDAINERFEVQVTIPEGKNLYEVAEILETNGVCDSKAFLEAFNHGEFEFSFLKKIPDNENRFYLREGYFFPDTYRFFKDSEPAEVIEKVFINFEDKLSKEILNQMKALDMSMDEAITLASMIQAEASGTAEMNNVSSVFHNRLNHQKSFPLLQSDPTSKYVREVIEPRLSELELSEEEKEAICSAYDTYIGKGLPPGPICNPGLDAIKAAVSPNQTDYYFFCSNINTMEFYYAKTNEQHEKNLVKAGLK